MFAYRATVEGDLGNTEVAFTDSSSDLGDAQGAAARSVGLTRLATHCGAKPMLMKQVHGSCAQLLDDGEHWPTPLADALVTGLPGLAAVVRVADCVPVLLADPVARVVAAAHAGRVGFVDGIIASTLSQMRECGATEIFAWVGPHICGNCYEVPELMRAEVVAAFPETFATTTWGTPALDIGAGVVSQLISGGCTVTEVPGCTYEDARWHSFRRDGVDAGRMAGVVWMSR